MSNRGKRSITVDLANQDGRQLLLGLVAEADVFLTSCLPSARAKLQLDVEHLRAVNPGLIYAVGSGWGATGPMANTGSFDLGKRKANA
jgi:crotonobetainyl-CoA:carnitine CoA-transferase CaiB-like acyl-CoA transferase